MPDDATPSDEVPWILRHAAERRAGGERASDGDAPGGDAPGGDAPASRFRRRSGASIASAVATPNRGAQERWDDEPAWAPPPPRPPLVSPAPARSPAPGGSPYLPPSARRRFGGGVVAAAVAGALVVGGGTVAGVVLLVQGGTPSRAEFVAGADAACRRANAPVAAIAGPSTYADLAAAAGTVATAIDSQLGQLRGREQPGGAVRTEVAGVDASLEGTAAAAGRLRDAAGRQDDVATIAAANDLSSAAGEARARATTAGFAACAVGLQPGIEAVLGGSQSVIRAGFVARADALCGEAAQDLAAVEFPEDDEGPSFVAYVGATIEVFERLVADLRRLPVPPGDEAAVSELITAQDLVNAKEREFQAAAVAEDFDRMDAVDREITTLITAADARFDAYGLESCGSRFGY